MKRMDADTATRWAAKPPRTWHDDWRYAITLRGLLTNVDAFITRARREMAAIRHLQAARTGEDTTPTEGTEA